MKYDEKTGEKTPESRSDEIRLSLEKLHEIGEQCKGFMDKDFERNALLIDISISLGLITDILGVMYNREVNHGKDNERT